MRRVLDVAAKSADALVPLAREMEAVLACGEGSMVSHRSAAAIWHLLPAEEDVAVDITSGGRGGRRPGIRVHRTRRISPDQVRHLRGLPLTAPGRTLFDVAEMVADRNLELATHEAIARRLVDPRRLLLEADRHRGRRGIGRLKEILEAEGSSTLTRSEAEERFLALVRAGGLPEPEANVRAHGYEVDFLWRRHRLAVEIDGFQFHSSRRAFERDRKRDAELPATTARALGAA